MAKWQQGQFKPKNPHKCMNKENLTFRSSWEIVVMKRLDEHPCVLKWGSEIIQIPYYNPLKNRMANYIPDFFIQYIDSKKKVRNVLVEVKPLKECIEEKAKSKYDKLCLVLNQHKWQAAKKFCDKIGIEFMIMTENQLFGGSLR